MIQSIPLNKLMPSPHNVRQSSDEQADRQLKADIAARGLLQNLVVAPAKKPRGSFTVEWWRPTGANYFDRVPKAVTLAALEEAGGPAFASAYAGLKKAELAQSAERIFAGDFIGKVEAKQRALAWVPDPMRFAPALEFIAGAQSDELPPWDEEPASGSEHASDEEPESGGDDAGSDGCEPSRVEEAA